MRRLLVLATVGFGAGATGMATAQVKSPAVLAGSKLEQSARCEKGSVLRIAASDSRVSVLGECSAVLIEGDRNWIEVEHARRIVTTGSRNTVLYDDGTTRVEDKGKANSLAARWPQ